MRSSTGEVRLLVESTSIWRSSPSTSRGEPLISLDPVRDTTLWNAIDHHLARLRRDPANEQRPFAELQVDAVMGAVGSNGTGSGGPRIPEIVIHTDHRSACHGRHDQTLCETIDGQPIPVPTMQRLCCEAILQAVIVDPDGTVDRLCAERRTANRQQRRMLAATYPTCAHPHCEVGFSQCRIHHVEWFTNGGETILANLLPLCETHHHLVHEGGWSLRLDGRRRVTWIRPDGTTWHTDAGPPRTKPPPAGRHRGDGPSRPRRRNTPSDRSDRRPATTSAPT